MRLIEGTSHALMRLIKGTSHALMRPLLSCKHQRTAEGSLPYHWNQATPF